MRRVHILRTTVAGKKSLCPLDRLQRQFHAGRPNHLRVSDLMYVSTLQGWLYVAFRLTCLRNESSTGELVLA